MVPRITYIPETYRVSYQEVSDAARPAQVSAPVNGTTNLTSVDDEYFVVLRNLQPNTRYSFQILSSNTVVTIFTSVMTFLTSTSGEDHSNHFLKAPLLLILSSACTQIIGTSL